MSHGGHGHHQAGHGHDEDPFATEEGAEFWESWAPVLETGTIQVSEALLDAARVTAGTQLLDLACGLGHTTVAAAHRGAHATGLDLNEHMLARAHQADGATYVLGDMMAPPPGPWDAIVSRFGAHHAEPAWLPAAATTLAPGGWLAIAEWHPDSALFDVDTHEPMPSEDTAEDWVARFEAADLQDVQAIEVPFTIDFGDEATFQRFMDEMEEGATNRVGAPGGRQDNRAYIVAGRR